MADPDQPILTRIDFARYKSFDSQQTLRLRPITLLFGRNSVGKSAALRLLPILATAARGRGREEAVPSVFDYEAPALRGATFKNLLSSRYPGGAIKITFHWAESSYDVEIKEGNRIDGEMVTQFRFRDGKGEIAGVSSEAHSSGIYDIAVREGEEKAGLVELQGLVPSPIMPALDDVSRTLANVAAALHSFSQQVSWIGATRIAPPRHYRFGPGARITIKHDGAGVAQALRASSYRQDGVADAVSAWLNKTCGCVLSFAETDLQSANEHELYTFSLRSSGGSNFIPIQDVGEGITQALPIITLCHQARVGLLGRYPVLALEQPELHLHPHAEIVLADEIADCVSMGSEARHVIETHSESVLLSMQLAIVQRKILHTDVVVYWVDQSEGSSNLSEITFDKQGYPSGGWPPGVFRESLAQARQLASLRARAT